jgi:hypothetical protein
MAALQALTQEFLHDTFVSHSVYDPFVQLLTAATTADARHRFSDTAAYHRHWMVAGGDSVITMKDNYDR